MFLIRIFTLSLSAWEMISNQNFKEPPMVAILSLCVSLFEFLLYPLNVKSHKEFTGCISILQVFCILLLYVFWDMKSKSEIVLC